MCEKVKEKLKEFLGKIYLTDFYICKKQEIVKAKKIYPFVKGKFRNKPVLVKRWKVSKIKTPLIYDKEVDKTDHLLKEDLVDRLLKVRKYGGYFVGHLPVIRKLIVFFEDLLTLRGLRSSYTARVLHWATGNSTFYLNYESGDDAKDGSSWANAWKTITSGATAARIAPSDVIRIAKSPAPVSIGNATWTNLSKTVTLETAQNATVDLAETAWTAANSATVTRQGVATDAKEGSYCMQITAPSSPATNKLYAYYTISQTNFSSYQKLSFWIKNEVAVSAGNWKICLCSDTAGATIVDTFKIPAIPSTGRWLPLTLTKDGGGNLGSSIRSIALYSDTAAPTASKYIRVDDFVACTTNGLNLQSLISKNSAEQGGTEGWYGIQSINGTTVLLDNDTNTKANAGRGYSGTTETKATYKRETIKTALASSTSTAVQEVQDSGTLGNNIEFQGGYDTSSGNQTGETFFDGLNGYGYGIYLNGKSCTTLNYLNVSRYNYGVYYTNSSNNTITTISNANNNNYYGVYYYNDNNNNTITTLSNANNNGFYGVFYYISNNNTITTLSNANNNPYGVSYYISNNNTITTLSNANNNTYDGVSYYSSSDNTIITLSTSGNGTNGISNSEGINYIFNALITEATEVSGFTNFANSRLFSHNHDQTPDNHWIFTDGGTIHSQTAVRHTASGIAWQLSPTSANRSANYPLDFSVAKIAVEANKEVTVKAWIKKDDATKVAGKLVCRGGQIAGVSNDVIATVADSTDWQQITITFTPTAKGVVEIEVWAVYVSGSANVFVDDLEISQS